MNLSKLLLLLSPLPECNVLLLSYDIYVCVGVCTHSPSTFLCFSFVCTVNGMLTGKGNKYIGPVNSNNKIWSIKLKETKKAYSLQPVISTKYLKGWLKVH